MMLLLLLFLSLPLQAADEDLDALATSMQGTFSSLEHSKRDSTFTNVVVHLKRIWHDRTDGVWIYEERSSGPDTSVPRLQQIHRLRRYEERFFERVTFAVKEPLALRGAWKDTTVFDTLSPQHLVQRRGCEVYLRKFAEGFTGSTEGMACAGDTVGVAYATTEITVTPRYILSWERGFTSAGKQVTGPPSGPYVFLRESS